ncbi:MAG: hypothetical protein S4CHLAM102_12280 [Chlamydiia bacterium]|nr:hypothetical protein [Chlamydiia bacterium]
MRIGSRFALVWLLAGSLFGVEIGVGDVPAIAREMFSYHVENKEFSPLVAKRSVKVFFDQIDPEKIYLMRDEVGLYLDGRSDFVGKLIGQFERGKLDMYEEMLGVGERAIARAQMIRRELIAEILTSEEVAFDGTRVPMQYAGFARDEGELRERIRIELYKALYRYGEEKSFAKITLDRRERILEFWDKKRRGVEAKWMGESDKRLAVCFLKALAKSLDAHTAFYSPDEALEIKSALQKQFCGVGVVLREGIDGAHISELVVGGPASESGKIEVGDRLVQVDREDVRHMLFAEVMERLKGPVNSKVNLVFERRVADEVREVQVGLKRKRIVMDDDRLTYTREPFGDGFIGKIKLPTFYDNNQGVSAASDLKSAIRALKKEGDLQGIVIDMRSNSGGFLSQAIKVAGMFVPKGVIVIAKYANDEIQYSRDADGKMFYNGPVVLLTSRASASATEIVAQAIKDYGAAVIVGDERTYGKGSMQHQTITDDSARHFYKVTVGRYYTISGTSTQIKGVEADIVVPTILSAFNVGERYLQFPIDHDQLEFALVGKDSRFRRRSFDELRQLFALHSQRSDSVWKRMIPQLAANSAFRLKHDLNYQAFMKKVDSVSENEAQICYLPQKKKERFPHGKEDLQMNESVNILKDMIRLKAVSNY